MNPVMILIVGIGAVALWFLLSFLYKPIGNFVTRVFKETVDTINEDEESKNKE